MITQSLKIKKKNLISINNNCKIEKKFIQIL
jgi:hypothetical protein